jgi:predicted nucleic acid-binding protein
MVAIDNTTLALLLHPKAKPPNDPQTRLPLEKPKERIEQLMLDLDADDERVIIPTPVLSEFLILAGKEGPQYLEKIQDAKTLLLRSFDERAAIELAAMELGDRSKVGKKAGSDAPYQKVKFDRQIVAVAKVNGAHTIYSDDDDVRKFATKAGMKVVSTWELAIPPSKTPLFDALDDLPEPTTAPHDEKKKS